MTKSKKTALLVLFTVLVLAAAVLPFAVKTPFKSDATEAVVECELKSVYSLGEKLTVPSAKLLYKDTEYSATDFVVEYPDGQTISEKEVDLNQSGNYKVIYYSKENNLSLSGAKTFSVTGKTYSVTSSFSSVSYGDLEMAQDKKGLKVTLFEGDKLTFSSPLTLDKITKILQVYPINRDGKISAEYIVIRLTDCYDSSIYVDAIVYTKYDFVYFRAGASGQDEMGLAGTSSNVGGERKLVYIDGKPYVTYISSGGAWSSNTKKTNGTVDFVLSVKDKGYGIMYDSVQKRVFIREFLDSGKYNDTLVGDFANEEIHSNIFGGFTTGEVFVSVFADKYNGSIAEFEIDEALGFSGEELVCKEYSDTAAPVINVLGECGKSSVNIACGETFTLPEVEVYDVNYKGDLSVEVWYNYLSEYKVKVAVSNGAFVPKNSGAYTVIYTATDCYGNKSIAKVELNSVKTTNGKGINFDAGLDMDFKAGKKFTIPEWTAEGLNGKVTVSYRVTYNDEVLKLTDGAFIPEYSGDYTFIYSVTDGVYSYDFDFVKKCEPCSEVAFSKTPVLPRYFIKDATYSLDEFSAYVFDDGSPKAVETKLFVSFDGVDFVEADYSELKISASENVKIKYVSNGVESDVYTVPVQNVNFGSDSFDKGAYFVGDFKYTPDFQSIIYKANGTGESKKLSYINEISAKNLTIEFSIPNGFANFDSLTFTVTDRKNPEVFTSFRYFKEDGKYYFSLSGEKKISLDYSFDNGEIITLTYKASATRFYDGKGLALVCPMNFSDDRVNLDIELGNVYGNAAIDIRKINNQAFNDDGTDSASPQISVEKSDGIKSLGETATIYMPVITDVLSPIVNKNITCTVKSPDGKTVTSEDGVKLFGNFNKQCTIKLSQYGDYTVSYKATDLNGKSGIVSYKIRVKDNTEPEITFKSNKTEFTASKTGWIKIQKYTVKDDVTANENLVVSVTVIHENGSRMTVKDDKFNATEKGVYTVTVMCKDEEGNCAFASYKITVGR